MRNFRIPAELLLLLVAFWHSVHWCATRLHDSSDDSWWLLSLLTVAVFVVNSSISKSSACKTSAKQDSSETTPYPSSVPRPLVSPPSNQTCVQMSLGTHSTKTLVERAQDRLFTLDSKSSAFCIAFIIMYCVSFSMVPPLVRCLIALMALGVVAWNYCAQTNRNALALFGLLALSSPVLASLQFFIGFPLRVLVTNATALLLKVGGLAITVSGTAFEHNARMVLVDSPCSGINMLWVGCYLCFVLCWIKQLSAVRSILFLAFTVSSVIAANVGRTGALVVLDVLKERGNVFPEFAHDAIGGATFISLAVLLVLVGERLAGKQLRAENFEVCDERSEQLMSYRNELRSRNDELVPRENELIWRENELTPRSEELINAPLPGGTQFATPQHQFATPQHQFATNRHQFATISFIAACAFAAALPFTQAPYHEDTARIVANGMNWPKQFEGQNLKPIKLSDTESKFSSGFPGRIAKFSDGRRTILFRQVNKPTRQLHPSSDCYRGNSFNLRPLPALRDGEGKVWSRFSAQKGSQSLEVRELVTDAAGRTWSDTSAWYWSALLGKTQSPWVAVTVAAVAE